jgi:hypothetical protein
MNILWIVTWVALFSMQPIQQEIFTPPPWCETSYSRHTPTVDEEWNRYKWLYSRWDGTEICAYIYKQQTWTNVWRVIYSWMQRHVHNVKYDKSRGVLYATVGDDIPRLPQTKWQWRLLGSYDKWASWKILQQWPRANYITIDFYKWCVFLGEDSAQYNPSSRIIKTCDDKKFVTVFTLKWKERANWWSSVVGDKIYWWTVVDQKWFHPTIYSYDGKKIKRERKFPVADKPRVWVREIWWYSWFTYIYK